LSSPGPQSSGVGSISRGHVSETQQISLPLQVTSAYLYHPTPTDTTFCSVSPKSAQPSPSQDPTWKKETILCYCEPRAENMADTSRAERGSTCGMERERRHFVSLVIFVFLQISESPAALYNHPPVSPYHFMRRRLWGRTSLSEGRRLPVNPEMVRLFLAILSDISG
jgi:hypothetical protein